MRFLAPLVALLAVGCGSDDASETKSPGAPPLLEPPAAGQGVQFSMETSVAPGAEVEHCKFVEVGSDDLWVNRDEVRFTEGSHHFLLYGTNYDTIPTENRDGEPVDTSGVFDCTEGVQVDWEVTGFLGGSQNSKGDSAITFPPGVAMEIEAGSVLLMNAHYINVLEEEIRPEVFINLHTIPEAEVETEGGILFWYNPFIRVGANSQASVRAGCTLAADVNVVALQSHMHRRGVDFVAEVPGAASDMNPLYTTDQWENVSSRVFEPALRIEQGTKVEYECRYENTEARDVYQGFTTKDEMCVLAGTYYPRAAGVGQCFADFWWEGQGTVSCADSLSCFQNALLAEDRFAAMSDCVLDSDPAIADPLSSAMGCLFLNFSSGESPFEACAEQFDTCRAQ